jgi:hypothetical protein
MKGMLIVTSGIRYMDIDCYACIVAYKELLDLLGKPAVGTSSFQVNESVTAALRALKVPFTPGYKPMQDDQFVIVDASDPSQLDPIVDQDRIVAIFDHHTGFEKYWADKIGGPSQIEFIGAAATLIYEQWEKAGKQDALSQESAQLLAAAILDNTLNFGAQVTTDRDRQAYQKIADHAGLDQGWIAKYFSDCQQGMLADLPATITGDSNLLTLKGLDGELAMGQLVVWDAKQILDEKSAVLSQTLGGMSNFWLANVVNVSEGRSYFVAGNPEVQRWLEGLLGVTFDGSVAKADRLWLRKEIRKAAQNQ